MNLTKKKKLLKKGLITKALAFLGLCILFVFLFRGYENKIFSISFVDEEDNIAIGKYLLKGEKLYSDIYTNHQPVTYIMSSAVQAVSRPNSILMVVKRHREFVIFWSFIWSILLIFIFGPYTLFFIIPYELTKYLLFGNLFLAETFTVYPLVFLFALLLNHKKQFSNLNLFLSGACITFLFFSLLPVLPVVFVTLLLTVTYILVKKKNIFIFILGILSILIPILFFSSIQNLYRDTYFANWNYYLPDNTLGKEITTSSVFTPLKYFLVPFNTSTFVNLLKLVIGVLLLSLAVIVVSGDIISPLLIIVFLVLVNLRSFDLSLDLNFHALPWYGMLIFAAVYSAKCAMSLKNRYLKPLFASFIILISFSAFLIGKDFIMNKINKDGDAYINFSQIFDSGEAVRIMKSDTDTLFVSYSNSLVYWQSDIKHAAPEIFYYPWMSDDPLLNAEVNSMFSNNPPAFVYCRWGENNGIDKYLYDNYISIKKDGFDQYLFVAKEKIPLLTEKQRQDLEYYRFSF